MESSDSPRSRSASATAAGRRKPQQQDPEPQYNEPPAATSVDPRLMWARPYIDPPPGGPRNDAAHMPGFTPGGEAPPAAGLPEAGMPHQPAAEPPAGWAPAPPSPPARGGRREPVRAVIGDEIRVPFIWCEFGACDATYTHPDALGERDLRARALAAGWRYDALGRRACPGCAQHDPTFWTARPPVPGNWRRAG